MVTSLKIQQVTYFNLIFLVNSLICICIFPNISSLLRSSAANFCCMPTLFSDSCNARRLFIHTPQETTQVLKPTVITSLEEKNYLVHKTEKESPSRITNITIENNTLR